MAQPKESKASDGRVMHYSVGALINRDGKYLLIDRVNPPFGFAGLAGHVDEGEDTVIALKREVQEESGLTITSHKLLFEEEIPWNTCSKDIQVHYWYLFECEVTGEARKDHEAKTMGWYTPEEMKELTLEPVWEYWLKKLGIL